MLEAPRIVRTSEVATAVIRLTVPRSEIQQVMGPAIQEVLEVVAAQGVEVTGPVFSHHFKMDPLAFDFEVGVPVASAVTSAGRVKPGTLPAATVARTTYRGGYEGLGAAWGAFDRWIAAHGYTPGIGLWESYVAGPESSPDPASWRTQLNRPLQVPAAETGAL